MNKSDTHAFVNQLLVYTLVMICFSGSIGLSAVWLRHQISVTANATKQFEARAAEVERHTNEIKALIAAEESLDVLKRRNIEWQLGLVLPREPQVVRVDESAEQRLSAKRNAEVFSPAATGAMAVRFPLASGR